MNASALNVRVAPTGGSRIVAILYRNQKVVVENVEDGWAKLSRPEPGYTAIKFLSEAPGQ